MKTKKNKPTSDSAVGVGCKVIPLCESCKFWNNNQAELEYNARVGICTCYKWKFTTTNYGDIMLLDRKNKSDKFMGVQRFESQINEIPFGKVEPSNYCLVTEENFGCIYHKKI